MVVISSSSTIQDFFITHFGSRFTILSFSTPKETFTSTNSFQAKFVIVDGKEHENALAFLRKYFSSKETRIFAISNEIRKSFLEKALQAGIDDFLQVPLVEEEVEEKLLLVPRKQSIQNKVEGIQKKSIEKHAKKEASSPHLFAYPKDSPSDALLQFPGCVLYIQVDDFEKHLEEETASTLEAFSDQIASFLSLQLRTLDRMLLRSFSFFVLFLGNTEEKEAMLIASNLQREVAKQHFSKVKWKPSISIAVTLFSKKPLQPLAEIKKNLIKAKTFLEKKNSSIEHLQP